MNLVSIIVVTHSRPTFLNASLRSCSEQDYSAKELVVVLNPPEAESEMIATQYGAKVLRTHRNLGFFPALNLGIANATGALVMVVDDDAYFESPAALTALVGEISKEATNAVVTCNIKGPCEGPPFRKSGPVHTFKTGFTLFRRKVFTEWAGYVPDTFFRAGGETFLANYLWDKGLSVRVLCDAWMVHTQTAVGRSNRAMNYYAIRNHALIVLMQEPLVVIVPSLMAKLWSTFLRIAWHRRDLVAWLRGWAAFLGQLPWALRQRRAISLSTYRWLRRLRRENASSASIMLPQSSPDVSG